MERDEFGRRRGYSTGRPQRYGSEERWFDDAADAPRGPREAERGSFGEREYGQSDSWAYGRGRPRRSDAASWPTERMGTNGIQPYWSPSQWGSGMSSAPTFGHSGSDYYEHGYDRGDYAAGDEPQYRAGGSAPYRERETEGPWAGMHDYGHGGFSGRGPKGYQRTDDRIHEEICERLTRHPGVDASEIEVKVKEGEVTLTGHVHERRAKHMAEDVVDAVSGVKDVHNELKVEKHEKEWSGSTRARGENGRSEKDEG